MQRFYLLVLSVLLNFSFYIYDYTYASQPQSVYERLKPYRTYLSIVAVTPVAEQFSVYFIDKTNSSIQISVGSLKEAKLLNRRNLERAKRWGGIVPSPDAVKEDVPEKAADLAQAIRARIQKIYPQAKYIKIIYEGRCGLVTLRETIPVSFEKDIHTRSALTTEVGFKYFPEDKRLVKHDRAVFGVSSMRPYPGSNAEEFVNFQLPAGFEGKSLLFTYAFEDRAADPVVRKYWDILEQAVLDKLEKLNQKYKLGVFTKFLNLFSKKIFKTVAADSDIDEILEKQDNTVLPKNLKQSFILNLEFYAQHIGSKERADLMYSLEIYSLEMLVDHNTNGIAKGTLHIADLGLNIQASFDVRTLHLELKVIDSRAKTYDLSTKLIQQNGKEILTDGAQVAIPALMFLGNKVEPISFDPFGEYEAIRFIRIKDPIITDIRLPLCEHNL